MAKAPTRLLEKLRDCKSTGVLRKSLFVDYTTGSDFQILEWAGDRHLKSLLAEIAMHTTRGLKDQGELSALCQACEKTTALAKAFDLAELAKLVDEGSLSTEQVGDAQKRKADVVEAVIAELYQKREVSATARDALEMLVAFTYDIGSRSIVEHEVCRTGGPGTGGASLDSAARDAVPALPGATDPGTAQGLAYPEQPTEKNAVSRLHEWSQKEKKEVDFPAEQLGGTWLVKVSVQRSLLEGVFAQDVRKQVAKNMAAQQALMILSVP